MIVRPLGAVDAPACVAVTDSAGWKMDEARWTVALGLGRGLGAFEGDTLLGTVVVNRFGDALAMIAMMVVRVNYKRRGIGMALMRHALEVAEARVVALYATPEGRPLYERLGFEIVGESLRMQGTTKPPDEPGPVRVAAAADLDEMLRLDELAHGASRSGLVRRLTEHGAAVVAERQGKLTGFALASDTTFGRVVGPVVSERADDASRLVQRLGEGHAIVLDVPEETAATWPVALGLEESSRADLMSLAGRTLPGRRRMVHGLASRAYG